MNNYGKIAIVVALALVVGVVLLTKQDRSGLASEASTEPQVAPKTEGSKTAETTSTETKTGQSDTSVSTDASASPKEKQSLPRLVDLGAKKCIPCKMMAPILEDLKKEYKGRMEVAFIDVWENREAGQKYGIRAIPTQIFYDASGKERFRHEGFYSKEDILAKCKVLGFDLEAK